MTPYTIEDWPRGRMLIPKGVWTVEAEKALQDPEVDGLALSYADAAFTDLEFLEAWPIRTLVVQDRQLTDLRPIERLAPTLENLFVQAARGATVDLTEFERLEKLEGDSSHFTDTVSRAEELREVMFWPYEGADLEPLADNGGLETITLKEADSVVSLSGVERLPNLRHLWIVATHLEDISDLRLLRSPLDKLKIEDSIRIELLDDLVELATLTWLSLDDVPAIVSLRPLEALRNLERFDALGTTRVGDKDLSPLTRLPKLHTVRMKNRAGYQPSVAELEQRLKSHGG